MLQRFLHLALAFMELFSKAEKKLCVEVKDWNEFYLKDNFN